MWLLKKTNRSFDTQQGLLNHIVNIYSEFNNPSLQAYLDNNNIISIPKCSCGNVLTFISFFKGFKETCNNTSCANKNAAKHSYKRYINGYQEYILNNLEFYKKNLLNDNIIDPYTHKSIGKLKYKMYMYRNVKDKDFSKNPWANVRTCIYCGNDIIESIFSKKTKQCNNKTCKLFAIHKTQKIENIYLKYVKYIDRTNTDITYVNRISKMLVDRENLTLKELSMMNNRFFGKPYTLSKSIIYNHELRMFLSNIGMREYVKSISIDWDSFLKRNYYSVCFKKCLNCGVDVKTSDIPLLKNNNSKDYCSHECYHKYISTKAGRDKYGFDSGSARKSRSDILKSKIANGTFTPNITNSWCKSRIVIDIDGKTRMFRSSWEVVFGIINKQFLYESKRIKYNFNGKYHNYVVDFEDVNNKILYEIKPDSLKDDVKVQAKREAAIEWCNSNNYTYVTIGNKWFTTELCKLSVISTLRKYDKEMIYMNKVLKGIK